MVSIFKSSRQVQTYESDRFHRLRPFYLCNYLQEMANENANMLKFGQSQLNKLGYLWVLVKLSVRINQLPKARTKIDEETWVQSVNGKLSNRSFCIKHGSNTLMMATSQWVCLSKTSRRPSAIPASISNKMQVFDNPEFNFGLQKLKSSQEPVTASNSYQVSFDEIDLAGHANNANYILWGLKSFDSDFFENNNLKSVDLNFLGESFEDDLLICTTSTLSKNHYLHEVKNENSGKVVCRLETIWQLSH